MSFDKQYLSLNYYHARERGRLDRKLSWLRTKNIEKKNKNICPVHYSYRINTMGEKSFEFSFNKYSGSPSSAEGDVILDPKDFKNNNITALTINNNWFVNLTPICFPRDVQGLLQLSE